METREFDKVYDKVMNQSKALGQAPGRDAFHRVREGDDARPTADAVERVPTPMNCRPAQAGVMLTECLIYIAVFAVLIGLAFSAFYRTLDNATRLRRSASDIARVLQAGERWRHDIRLATGPIVIVNSEEGPAYALHVPQSSGEVVYLFTGTDLLRRPKAEAPWSEALAGVKASRAFKDTRNRITTWRWEVELYPGRKKPVVRPLFTFQAVANHQQRP